MTPLWNLSGEFVGWLEDHKFYDAEGKRYGTYSTDLVYDHTGKYKGEVFLRGNHLRIGFSVKIGLAEAPIYSGIPFDKSNDSNRREPLSNVIPLKEDGFIDPSF